MSVITFPLTLFAAKQRWSQHRNDVEFRSLFGAQAQELSYPLWETSMVLALRNDGSSGAAKALLMKLKGRVNQLELWDQMRPVPIGTMRGSMTFNTAPTVGANSLSITAGAGQAAKTLLQGDLIGFGSALTQQVVMVVDDAVANGSGIIAVNIEPVIRNAFIIGDPVVWDHPKALFRQSSSKTGWDYSEMLVSGFSLDLLEDWRP